MQATLIMKHGASNIPLHTVLLAFALKLTHRLHSPHNAQAEPPGATHFLPPSRGLIAVDALHNRTLTWVPQAVLRGTDAESNTSVKPKKHCNPIPQDHIPALPLSACSTWSHTRLFTLPHLAKLWAPTASLGPCSTIKSWTQLFLRVCSNSGYSMILP